jgi:plasmid stability protein
MASLLVRNLSDDLVRRLKDQAARHGRSAEAEHRAILEASLAPGLTGREIWEHLSDVDRGGDLDFESGMDQTVKPAVFE